MSYGLKCVGLRMHTELRAHGDAATGRRCERFLEEVARDVPTVLLIFVLERGKYILGRTQARIYNPQLRAHVPSDFGRLLQALGMDQ